MIQTTNQIMIVKRLILSHPPNSNSDDVDINNTINNSFFYKWHYLVIKHGWLEKSAFVDSISHLDAHPFFGRA